jgi:Arc/MetJ-type ribon-helix-helix transcriptional regulator
MTISLSKEQEVQLQELIKGGHFTSPEEFIDASLASAFTESEAFAAYARAKLEESDRAKKEGRVVRYNSNNLEELLEGIRKRGQAKLEASQAKE